MYAKLLSQYVVMVTLLLTTTSSTTVNDCGSSATDVTVDVSECPDDVETCPLYRGIDTELTIKFTTTGDVQTINTKVFGYVLGVPLPFFPPNSGECENGLTCPLEKGQSYEYNSVIPIKSFYPLTSVLVEWHLVGDDGTDVVCVEINAEIVDKETD